MTLRIPFGLETLRARNASVLSVDTTGRFRKYQLPILVLAGNAMAPLEQPHTLWLLLRLEPLRVLSCNRCGLLVDWDALFRSFEDSSMEELHLAQVSSTDVGTDA